MYEVTLTTSNRIFLCLFILKSERFGFSLELKVKFQIKKTLISPINDSREFSFGAQSIYGELQLSAGILSIRESQRDVVYLG